MEVKGAEIAFSPGFRWGTTILPDEPITLEHVMDQTATTTLDRLAAGGEEIVIERNHQMVARILPNCAANRARGNGGPISDAAGGCRHRMVGKRQTALGGPT